MVIRCEYAEINGTQLAVMRIGHRQKCKMYALIQVFNAFQNGKKTTRIPRTTSTLHKRLKELQIETQICNLRQKHRLKLLKAIPHRVANCCLISHNDLLKLCRSCGVKTEGLGKKMEDVKTDRKNKSKKQTKRVKKRVKKVQLECRDFDEFVLEISGESDENDGCESTQKQLTTQLPNTSNSDIFFACKKSADNVHVHNRVLHSRHSNNTRSTCKQTENCSAEHANSSKSTTNSVAFSFSEPCLGFQACERKTVTFDIHSKAFSSTDGPLLDAARSKNMRGEVGFECGEKQGENMDDHNNTNTCNPVDIGHACDLSSETKTTPSKEKEYFGFTGQEKDDNSWQTFGDVPDQDGAAILEINNTDCTDENIDGEIRFVNGFQFAVAAQQIRVGGKDVESDSDQESELSNFEINSNLSDLSDLSVSSESLNSVSSTDTSLGVVTRVRRRARVGSNSDGESECTSTSLCSPARYIHDHVKPCHNNNITRRPNCGQIDSNNPPCDTNNLWSQHSAKYVKKINNSLRPKNNKYSNVNALDKNCLRNYIQRKGRGDHESERSAERSHGRNSGDVIAAAMGEHHDIESGAAFVTCMRQCEQTNTLVSHDHEKDEFSHGSTKLGQKRKSNQQRGELEESQIIPNGKRHKKKKKKKKKKDRDKFDKSLESYDVNGNCTKRTHGSDSCLRTETISEICPKRKENKGDPKKVAELKRKLEAISSELARLQKGKGKKSIGKGENTCSKKKRLLKPKETKRKTRVKRTKNSGLDLRTCTFKMSEFLFLPPSLVVREGDLRPACSMAVPRGVLPPNNHPIWQWKIGGSPLPKKPTRHKVLQHGANLSR